jgi:septum formation protein
MRLVLASTSPQRADLLASLRIEFIQEPPDVDEMALPSELPALQVERLAHAKAGAVSQPNQVSASPRTPRRREGFCGGCPESPMRS